MMTQDNKLTEKILQKTAVLGVVGLGYVGLPLAVEKAKAGFHTIGFDTQPQKVAMVNAGHNYIGDVVSADLSQVVGSGFLRASTDFTDVARCDCVCICVPTPLDAHQQPDLSYIRNAAEAISLHMHRDMLIVLESTTYPGSTEELILPILENSGLKCGEDFYLAFSPERVDPGNVHFKTKNTPKVVGGITPACTEVAAAMYEMILSAPVHRVSSSAVAEMEKILENTYRNVNIALVNELSILCHRMGISLWEVIEAAKSKPYGFQAFYPGPGLGGHCIPLDPYYLSWKAREFGFHTSLIESSMMIHDNMPGYCVERAIDILNRFGRAMNGARILIIGVAYKQDTDDCRESPAIKIIENLRSKKADVNYFDPLVHRFKKDGLEMESLPELTADIVSRTDLVIITAAHSNIDYTLIHKHAKAIFDTKNAMKCFNNRANIEVL